MARQVINVGTTANDGTGDNLRNSQIKANANFQELYDIVGSGYLPLDYRNVTILARGRQAGVVNTGPAKQKNDLCFGRVSDVLFWNLAIFKGGDPEDYDNNYEVLSFTELPIIP